MAHLCGLCLALRDDHGQFARAVTNYDGLVLSALVEAQSERNGGRRTAGPCPLRGMRTATIAHGQAPRLAAAVSLVLASAKVSDHVADGDGAFGRRPVAGVARKVATRWARQGTATGETVGFDTGVLLDSVLRQSEVEAGVGPGTPILVATEPTETATAAAFGHTAVLAGRPANAGPLREAGRLFGRVAHLLDAVEDLAEDERRGAWNPIRVTGTELAEVRRLCVDATTGIRLALREVTFTDRSLVHALLVHELDHAVSHTFDARHQNKPREQPPGWEPRPDGPYGKRRGFFGGCGMAALMFCTCQVCCAEQFHNPWTGEPSEGWCRQLDCCDCCDCCNCGCEGCDCCGDCDCCDCSC